MGNYSLNFCKPLKEDFYEELIKIINLKSSKDVTKIHKNYLKQFLIKIQVEFQLN